jgi:hypothetical protein
VDRVRDYVAYVVAACCLVTVCPRSGSAAASRPNGQAIVFGVGNYLRPTHLDGTTIAYQRFVSRDVAWRISLGADLRHDMSEASGQQTGEDSYRGSYDISEWDYNVSLSSEWLVYRGEGVSLFFGGGPRVAYTSRQDASWDVGTNYWWAERIRDDSFEAGLEGCLGVQWAAAGWLALHAEYNLRCMYTHKKRDYEWARGSDEFLSELDTRKTDGFLLDSRGVRFGLSVYY